ncbi:MAG: hypothetical protein QE264_07640 [Flavobacterium sp.]|nr:hypothetical protein [Flavobacterium sp.]
MKINKLLVQIILGFITAFVISKLFFSEKRKFDELALGTETVTYMAKNNNQDNIHLTKIDNSEELDFLNTFKKSGNKKVVLFLGNSQTHSINQMKVGQVNFIRLLDDRHFNSDYKVGCHSMPNAGLQEFYLSYMYWKRKLNIKVLVIPLFFDDLREDGIRDVFFTNLINERFLISDSLSYIGKKINTNLKSYWSSKKDIKQSEDLVEKKDNQALKETVQEDVENYLNLFLEKNSKTWNNRENVRGDFFVWLYQLRNTVLGINASTVRKMIPQRYNDNLEALQLLLDDCKKNDVKVILYIPPIRSDVPIPYETKLYTEFKNDIKKICEKEKGKFFYSDFDTIIPGKYWGFKEATNLLEKRELDYMHFQFKGHQILADSLFNHLNLIK